MRKFVSAVVVVSMLTGPLAVAPAHASGAVAGATEITQIANNIELVTSVAQQAQQLSYDIKSYLEIVEQYKNMVTNTLNIPNQIWSNVQNDLSSLASVVKQGQALAYSAENIGDLFKQKYPGFKKTDDFKADYRKWSATVMDSIKGSLQAANLQSSQFATEEGTLAQLRSMSASNQGRLQAIQTGNQIAVETATQMQKLRSLMMAQMQAQNAYMAAQEQKDSTRKAGAEAIMPSKKAGDGKTYEGFKGGSL